MQQLTRMVGTQYVAVYLSIVALVMIFTGVVSSRIRPYSRAGRETGRWSRWSSSPVHCHFRNLLFSVRGRAFDWISQSKRLGSWSNAVGATKFLPKPQLMSNVNFTQRPNVIEQRQRKIMKCYSSVML